MPEYTMDFFIHPNFLGFAEPFLAKYELEKIVCVGDEEYSKKRRKHVSKRVCIFCGATYPGDKFKTHPHLAAKAMGNTDLYSDFECDVCNGKFGFLENDLANFIGISRSIAGVHGSPKGFVGRKLTTKSRSFIGNKFVVIARNEIGSDAIEIDPKIKGKITLKATKPDYIPLNVYRALLKSALSILGEDEIKRNYGDALKVLNEGGITSGAVIHAYKLSFSVFFPFSAYIFRKRNPLDKLHTHVIAFHFQNHIISLPIILHREDISFCMEPFDTPICPPLFLNKDIMMGSFPAYDMRDLFSVEKISNEEDQLIIQLDPDQVKNGSAYDYKTKITTQKEFTPGNPEYIILTNSGMKLSDQQELDDFIKQIIENV